MSFAATVDLVLRKGSDSLTNLTLGTGPLEIGLGAGTGVDRTPLRIEFGCGAGLGVHLLCKLGAELCLCGAASRDILLHCVIAPLLACIGPLILDLLPGHSQYQVNPGLLNTCK